MLVVTRRGWCARGAGAAGQEVCTMVGPAGACRVEQGPLMGHHAAREMLRGKGQQQTMHGDASAGKATASSCGGEHIAASAGAGRAIAGVTAIEHAPAARRRRWSPHMPGLCPGCGWWPAGSHVAAVAGCCPGPPPRAVVLAGGGGGQVQRAAAHLGSPAAAVWLRPAALQ